MAIGAIWDDIWDEDIWNNLIWSQSASQDATPDDDSFVSQTNIAPSATDVTSNVHTLTGMNATAQASIDSGTMSVDSDGFSATTRQVSANGTIQARQNASAAELTTTTVNITVSGVVFEFSITTGELAATLTNAVATPSSTSATLNVDTDKMSGDVYWVVTQNATQPSIAQIKAGQDHLGAAADSAGTIAVSETGTQQDAANGLTPSTSGYFAHFVQETTADSNRISTTTFETLAPGDSASAFAVTYRPFTVRF